RQFFGEMRCETRRAVVDSSFSAKMWFSSLGLLESVRPNSSENGSSDLPLPFLHARGVTAKVRGRYGQRVAIANRNGTAQIWNISPDPGLHDLHELRMIVELGDYDLDGDGEVVVRSGPRSSFAPTEPP